MQELKEHYPQEPLLGNILETHFREAKSLERHRHED